ncbi:MAG: hypothetical protein U0271_15360 [Polyangiaceae bacterium]
MDAGIATTMPVTAGLVRANWPVAVIGIESVSSPARVARLSGKMDNREPMTVVSATRTATRVLRPPSSRVMYGLIGVLMALLIVLQWFQEALGLVGVMLGFGVVLALVGWLRFGQRWRCGDCSAPVGRRMTKCRGCGAYLADEPAE